MKTERKILLNPVLAMPYGKGEIYTPYDWVNPTQTKTPEEWPYSFSEYWIIRPPEGMQYVTSYSDRMQTWDYEKYSEAQKVSGWSPMMPYPRQSQLLKMVQTYFGSDTKLVGFGRSCHLANGYPLGIFATDDGLHDGFDDVKQ